MAHIKDSLRDDTDGTPMLRLTKGRSTALRDALDVALESGRIEKRHSGTIRGLHELFTEVAEGRGLDSRKERTFYVAHYPGNMGETKIGYSIGMVGRRARNTDSPQMLVDVALWELPSKDDAIDVETTMRHLYPEAHIRGDWFAMPVYVVVDRLTAIIGRRPDQRPDGN